MNEDTQTSEVGRAASVLNRCIEVGVDGQKFFAEAAAHVRSPLLKETFQRYSDERAAFVIALQDQMEKAGLVPENEGTTRGMGRRELMAIVHALEPVHREVPVLRSCVNELEAAARVYATAARVAESLPVDLRVMIHEQHASIRAALAATLARFDSH